MNDIPEATQKEKQDRTDMGKRILERIEDGFLKLHDLIEQGHSAGMMDKCECHELQNKCMELHFATLGLHCRLTAVAVRNGCDVPTTTPPGGGGVVIQGGPGR